METVEQSIEASHGTAMRSEVAGPTGLSAFVASLWDGFSCACGRVIDCVCGFARPSAARRQRDQEAAMWRAVCDLEGHLMELGYRHFHGSGLLCFGIFVDPFLSDYKFVDCGSPQRDELIVTFAEQDFVLAGIVGVRLDGDNQVFSTDLGRDLFGRDAIDTFLCAAVDEMWPPEPKVETNQLVN